MFYHSIKVPQLYKNAAKIGQEVSEGKGSIKQLVYASQKRLNTKALYALLIQTFKKSNVIEKLLKKSKFLIKEPRIDPWLAKILITELLWGSKRLQGESKPVKTTAAYEQIFKALLSDTQEREQEQVNKPRYVRINTIKITVNEAIEKFRNEGWVLKHYPETEDYLGFLDAVSTLEPHEFMVDLHIPYLLIFPPKTTFYQHEAYKNGQIILQDKASCLPVHILNPEPGSTVLDMCAAPGMKTTQCAAVMQNSGQIIASEIGITRFDTLKKIVESSGATCVKVLNQDVLAINGGKYPDVEYILVDPSCSGSGITDRVEIGQQKFDQNRLGKLAGFQIKVLRHALMRFPKARRVVYSTCSMYSEENEDVVRQVLETCTTYKLVPANKFLQNRWQNFGSLEFGDIGNYCLYAKPDIDLTSGFFVAVFQRLEEGERNEFLNARIFAMKMQMIRDLKEGEVKKNKENQEQSVEEKKSQIDGDQVSITAKTKRKKIKSENSTVEHSNINDNSSELELNNKGKRKKEKKLELDVSVKTEDLIKTEESAGKTKKKKIKTETVQVEDNKICKTEKPENVTEDKHKKRKKVKQSDETQIEIDANIKTEEQSHKSKKKKNKTEVSFTENQFDTETLNNINISVPKTETDSVIIIEEEQANKSKKKKRKIDELTIDATDANNESKEQSRESKKRKIKTETSLIENDAIIIKEEKHRNKSKKKKTIDDVIVIDDDNSRNEVHRDIENFNEYFENATISKHKKKKKQSEENDTGEVEDKIKIKKKKRSEGNEETEVIDCDNKKSKRKNKTVNNDVESLEGQLEEINEKRKKKKKQTTE